MAETLTHRCHGNLMTSPHRYTIAGRGSSQLRPMQEFLLDLWKIGVQGELDCNQLAPALILSASIVGFRSDSTTTAPTRETASTLYSCHETIPQCLQRVQLSSSPLFILIGIHNTDIPGRLVLTDLGTQHQPFAATRRASSPAFPSANCMTDNPRNGTTSFVKPML